jgi:hypothetical protein
MQRQLTVPAVDALLNKTGILAAMNWPIVLRSLARLATSWLQVGATWKEQSRTRSGTTPGSLRKAMLKRRATLTAIVKVYGKALIKPTIGVC